MQYKNNYRAGPLSVKHSRFCVEETKWLNTTARSLSSRAGSTIRIKDETEYFYRRFRAPLRELVVLFGIGSVVTLAVFFLTLWLLPFETFSPFPFPRPPGLP